MQTLSIRRILAVAAVAGMASGQTMNDRVQPSLERALAAGDAFVGVSAASGMPGVAPASLASIFGLALAVLDAQGNSQAAPLSYVSPDQIDYLVPPARR